MDNRRQPPSGPNALNRNKPFRKEGEKPYGYGKYQNNDRQFQPRNDRYGKPDGFQQRDNFKPREGGFQQREGGGGPSNREGGGGGGFRGREGGGGYQKREGGGGGGGYQNREGGGFQNRDNRFQRRDNRFGPRNDNFQPRRPFPPKGKKFEPAWKKENEIRIVSDMQVTDGKHRGKYLETSASPNAVPSGRRIRETAFKIMFRRIRARRFLNLGAGCGMIGIEAISRGAIVATMVERSARLCSFIKKNLQACEIKEGHGEIVEGEIVPFLKKMWKRRRYWDVVYLLPPSPAENDAMFSYLGRGSCVAPGGTLVIEHDSERFFPERIGVLKRFRVVVQGDRSLSFFDRK